MNFDNLVEDANKFDGILGDGVTLYCLDSKAIAFPIDGLKALITQYVNTALAQGQEPVGWLVDAYDYMDDVLNSDEKHLFITDKRELSDYIGTDEEPGGYEITPIFTHAQPSQIAEIQAQALESLVTRYEYFKSDCQWLANNILSDAEKLRKGEPL